MDRFAFGIGLALAAQVNRVAKIVDGHVAFVAGHLDHGLQLVDRVDIQVNRAPEAAVIEMGQAVELAPARLSVAVHDEHAAG